MARCLTLLLVLLLAALAPAAPASGAGEKPTEYELKAAVLYKISRFVTWPEDAFEDEESPLIIAVVGPDPFGPALDRAFQGRKDHGRVPAFRRYTSVDEVERCHILFVSRAATRNLAKLLDATSEYRVLLVSDTPSFAQDGGAVNFYSRAGSLRFEINPAAARRAGLEISAKLLELARIVRE